MCECRRIKCMTDFYADYVEGYPDAEIPATDDAPRKCGYCGGSTDNHLLNICTTPDNWPDRPLM